MGSRATITVLFLLCLLVTADSVAQKQQQVESADNLSARQAVAPARRRARPALLNTNDALAVIGAALESRDRGRARYDCSHLVHSIYESAGFPYTYASSSALYAGVAEFRQVTRPQVGDLVVWTGHVGIVVSPGQQTFFSALRTGLGVESYTSPYWSARGWHRFYRYVKRAGASAVARKSATRELTPVALQRAANTDPGAMAEADQGKIGPDRVRVVSSGRPKPKDVTGAILQAFNTTGEQLGDADVLGLAPSLIVFSQLEVKAVKIHGEDGQAVIKLMTSISVAQGKTNLKRKQQAEAWALHRVSPTEWEVQVPPDAIYLPQNDAVRVLSKRLAFLAEPASTASPYEKSELAQMLSTLLAE